MQFALIAATSVRACNQELTASDIIMRGFLEREDVIASLHSLLSLSPLVMTPGCSDPAREAVLSWEWEMPVRSRWDRQSLDPTGAGLSQTAHFGHGFKLRRKLSIRNRYPDRFSGEWRHHLAMILVPSTSMPRTSPHKWKQPRYRCIF